MGFLHPSSPFQPPATSQYLLTTPFRYLISLIHSLLLFLLPPPSAHPTNPLKIICISDTHTHNPLNLIPPGDILIHAGDLTSLGTHAELTRAISLLKAIHAETARGGFQAIIVIGGNHDSFLDPRSRSRYDRLQKDKQKLDWGPIIYLEREAAEITIRGRKLKVFGMGDIPKCGGRDFAWQYPRNQGRDVWEGEVPEDVDVLITHTPPKGYLDIPLGAERGGMGCRGLREEWGRVKPALHVFGHVHSGYGRVDVSWDEGARRWERVADRGQGGPGEWVDWRLWWEGGNLIWWDFKRVLWTRIWGGEIARRGRLVNAALTYQTTSDLGNDPQVVYL